MNDFLTVSEFAKRAGVTKQSVYQRIQGGLKKYVKDLNGQKVIQIQALYDVYGLDLEQGLEQDLNKDSQGQNQVNLAVIEMLRAELEEKNRQLREKDLRITELTDRITEMGKAAQALHAGTMQAQLGPGPDRSQEPEQVITVEDQSAAQAEPEKKRHWWKWRR